MIEAQPSRTALRVAMRRAAHQIVDAEPLVFRDAFALRLLDPATAEELKHTPRADRKPYSAAMRAWVVARARVAEDTLHEGVTGGATQYLVLGAGLDTFALRNPYPELRVYEVDHPATQAWKQERLRSAGIAVPETATLVPVDFERESLEQELQSAGFDRQQPTVTAWLGVVPYLTASAFAGTLDPLGSLPRGSSVVFDYAQPREVLPPVEQLMHDSLAARVAQAGEPFQLYFTPAELAAELDRHGLVVTDDWGAADINARYFVGRSDGLSLRGSGGRLCRAVVV